MFGNSFISHLVGLWGVTVLGLNGLSHFPFCCTQQKTYTAKFLAECVAIGNYSHLYLKQWEVTSFSQRHLYRGRHWGRNLSPLPCNPLCVRANVHSINGPKLWATCDNRSLEKQPEFCWPRYRTRGGVVCGVIRVGSGLYQEVLRAGGRGSQ